eukprot:CAMPEP_0178739556 /NCGR_PEP_ID=MMETSP0744-20121128/4119_1 /TAXON_ID=913974 /ORGANISM="Nitzschia punctata, Strain CCMP561" /LENGTH=139 /DNA_ID=CAMNT_0020392269 /DNA_START=119 /DNA_END=539 /DNA_ORIENTATION=-
MSTSLAFTLQMASSSSSSPTRSSRKQSGGSSSSTKLFYASPESVATLDSPPTVTAPRRKKKTGLDPVKAIAFLNDPERKYKKRMRPRYLSDLDRERRALTKAAAMAQAKANYEFGRRAAERAIQSVLKEHGIEDDTILP